MPKATGQNRKKILIALFFGALLAAAIWPNMDEESTLVSDLRVAVEEKKHPDNMDVMEVVRSYFPLGMTKEEALTVLRESGFEIYEVKKKYHFDSINFDESYIATFEMRRGIGKIWFLWEAKIIVSIKSNIAHLKQIGRASCRERV